jgi:hypothetical protein
LDTKVEKGVDATNWAPKEKDQSQSRQSRAQAMREAHRAAAHNKWLEAEIQASIDDPRPSAPHEEVMSEMEMEIARLPAAKRARMSKQRRGLR